MSSGFRDRWFACYHHWLSKLYYITDRQGMAVALIGLLAFAGSLAVGFIAGIAEPRIHDEFSYLLAADTFAQGRITNPTHPLWVHFESIHIIHHPTYMSKYPPGQGLMLASGQVIAGHPIVGVWFSMGLMCAAICWMLYAWLPPRWAFLGGFLAVINPILGITGYWAQSYWGGAVAATGGALILGGIRRVMRRANAYDAVLIGVGLAIIANTRPYEGLILCLLVGLMLLRWMLGKGGPAISVTIRRIVTPIILIVILAAVAMGLYNFRVTGNVFRLPYQVHQTTYGMAPLFVWQKPFPERTYLHQAIRDFHERYDRGLYESQRSLPMLIPKSLYLLMMSVFYGLNVLAIPLIGTFPLFIAWTIRNRWGFRASQIYLISILAVAIETYGSIHYLAPVCALMYFFGLSGLRLWQFYNPAVGRLMLWLVPLLSLIALAASFHEKIAQMDPSAWHHQRAQLVRHLSAQDGHHLILVRYGPRHPYKEEWVYNEASIDAAKIVWARQMNRAEDCRLIDYYRHRHIWSLAINGESDLPVLKPYARNLCRPVGQN